MSADPATAFLALARAQRLLPGDELTALARPGELTAERLSEVTDRLLAAGDLTPYQAQLLRAGRGDELLVAGYPVVGHAGPGEFHALHPSLGDPVVLRKLPAARFATDAARNEYVRQAQDASVLRHANLATLLDAGLLPTGDVFLSFAGESPPGEDLFTLVGDVGPMPADVACVLLRGVAAALQVAADRGTVHGDVQPRTLRASPLTPMAKPRADGTPRLRPTADATVKLAGLGTRLPLADDAGPAELAFAAPERLAGESLTAAADVYGLGATLYFLLTGLAPAGHCETRAGLVAALRHGPAPLPADVPPPLAEVVLAMLSVDPGRRPGWTVVSASLGGAPSPTPTPLDKPAANALADLIDEALAANVGPWTPAEPLAAPSLTAAEAAPPEHPLGRVEALEVLEGEPPVTPEEGFVPREYTPGESGEVAYVAPFDPDALPAEPPPEPAAVPRSRVWAWVGLGVALQVLAVTLWVAYFGNPFADAKAPAPPPKPAR